MLEYAGSDSETPDGELATPGREPESYGRRKEFRCRVIELPDRDSEILSRQLESRGWMSRFPGWIIE